MALAEFSVRTDRDAKRQARLTGIMAREVELSRTRNIGIMAHIDAGKTTRQNAFCITQVLPTSWARCTTALR
ncbi:MAG: hypothetical protein Ct9H300mP25_08940 [Acidobacteriota bacterium]|nr:MAG: hypothetical protein Ct9H300mP25_08940 [Acidobacteriota bacterium]